MTKTPSNSPLMGRIDTLVHELCPEGVEKVKLVNVANVLYGCPFDATLFSEDDSFIPLIRIRDVITGIPSTYYSGEYSEQYVIHKGDILVGMDGNFNLGRWNDRDGVLCQRTCKIESKAEKIVLNNYLYHLLGPIFKTIEDNTPGGSVKHLSAKVINSIEIPLPPLSIQQEIVSVLDSFTTLIDKMKQEVEKRKKQMEYYREKLLTFEDGECEWKTLGELFVIKNGLNKEKDAFGHGTPIINYTDVYKKRCLYSSDVKGLVELTYSEISRYDCKKGDVFFTRTSETKEEVGFPSVLLENIENCTFSGFVLRARPLTDDLLPEYCKYCFFTFAFRKEVIKRATLTTRALTNGSSLSKISIPIPDKDKQSSIVSTLDKFESYISKLEKMIALRQKQYEYYREQLLTFE